MLDHHIQQQNLFVAILVMLQVLLLTANMEFLFFQKQEIVHSHYQLGQVLVQQEQLLYMLLIKIILLVVVEGVEEEEFQIYLEVILLEIRQNFFIL